MDEEEMQVEKLEDERLSLDRGGRLSLSLSWPLSSRPHADNQVPIPL